LIGGRSIYESSSPLLTHVNDVVSWWWFEVEVLQQRHHEQEHLLTSQRLTEARAFSCRIQATNSVDAEIALHASHRMRPKCNNPTLFIANWSLSVEFRITGYYDPGRLRHAGSQDIRSLNRVPALIGWGKGGNITSAGWQVTLCDPIWHVSSRSGEACCELLYPVTYFTFTYIDLSCHVPISTFCCTVCSQSTNVTDRRTDGRHARSINLTCIRHVALKTKPHSVVSSTDKVHCNK